MKRTIERIQSELMQENGVKRYAEDLYYGGGQWIILTCWMGWYYAVTGQKEKAEAQLRWVESNAEELNYFPEQVLKHLNFPHALEVWKEKWAKTSPAPLLWSHAMYLVLLHVIDQLPKRKL